VDHGGEVTELVAERLLDEHAARSWRGAAG
jgi:hypothetical protein